MTSEEEVSLRDGVSGAQKLKQGGLIGMGTLGKLARKGKGASRGIQAEKNTLRTPRGYVGTPSAEKGVW